MTDKPPLIESLRRYGSDFISHAASRGIEDIEAAGELMLAAARVLAEQPAEQQPQEPVAWCDQYEDHIDGLRHYSDGGAREIPLYTAPQPRRHLTDEEICAALGIDGSDDWTFTVAYAIIAAYERKNGIGEQP